MTDDRWDPPGDDAAPPSPGRFDPPPSSGPPSSPPPSTDPPSVPPFTQPPQEPPGYDPAAPPPYPGVPGQAPPPGYLAPPPYGSVPPPVATPAKKRRGCLFWALIAFVAFVLLLGGCGAFVYFQIRGPIDATNDFLGKVEAGDFAAAEELVAPGCEPTAASIEADLGDLTDYTILLAFTTTDEADTGGTVAIAGDEQPFTASLIDTSDGWLVCTYSFTELEISN